MKKIILVTIINIISIINIYGVTLKIGSVAPEQSPWGNQLNKLAADWMKASGGEVVLKFYHGGITGDEQDMLRKIRIGQLQGGVFTTTGLAAVSKEIFTLSIPFLIQNDKELDYILEKTRDYLEKKIEEQKFVVIAISKGGWVNFFSKNPVITPNDLKSMKLGVSDNEIADIWKNLGFNIVRTPSVEITAKLNTGMIDSFYTSPIAAAGYQWFGLAKNMASIKLSPFVGAILLSHTAWKQIPDTYKKQLLQIARDAESKLNKDITDLEANAIKIMTNYGLVINKIPPDAEKLWKEEFQKGVSVFMKEDNKAFSKEFYDMVVMYLEEYRKNEKR